MTTKAQLIQKMKKNSSFDKEMQKADQNYRLLCQQAHYSNLSRIREDLLSKFQNHKNPFDVHFFYQPYQQQSDKTILYFINKLTRPNKPYVLIYFNDGISSNNLTDFKSMLGLMPIQFFLHLQRLYILKPSFRNKASGFLSFGTITKYINAKITHLETIDQLCQNLGFKKQDIFSFIPKPVKQIYFNKQEQQQLINSKKMTSTVDSQNSMSKPKDTKLQLKEYVIGDFGIPQLFEMLIFYFKNHKTGLQQQGLFRKSVSIVDEQEALIQMKKRNYNFLQKVQNPHLVANLMKRFLAKLKSPIIPYQLFNEFIKRSDYPAPYMKQKMKFLQQKYETHFLTLLSMLKFFIEDVLPRKQKNKMTIQNVGICMAPCIMWAEQRSIKDLMYSTLSINVLTSMINNFETIFGDKKAQKKLFRNTYLNQKKKSINQSFSFLSDCSENDNQKQIRVTPNFQQHLINTTQSYLQQLGQESDDQITIEQQGSTNIIKQTSQSALKFPMKKEEQLQQEHEKYLNQLEVKKIKSQQINIQTLIFQCDDLKYVTQVNQVKKVKQVQQKKQIKQVQQKKQVKQEKQQINRIQLQQQTQEFQITQNMKKHGNFLKPQINQKKRKGIFSTQFHDKNINSKSKSNKKYNKSIQ